MESVVTDQGFIEFTDKETGFMIRVPPHSRCGVSPLLAAREARHSLQQAEKKATGSLQDLSDVMTYVSSLWDGMRFRMHLVAFPNRPVVELEVRRAANSIPTLLQEVFLDAMKDNYRHSSPVALGHPLSKTRLVTVTNFLTSDKPSRNGVVFTKEALQSAVEKFSARSLTPQEQGLILSKEPVNLAMQARVTLAEDGTTIKSIDGPISFNLVG